MSIRRFKRVVGKKGMQMQVAAYQVDYVDLVEEGLKGVFNQGTVDRRIGEFNHVPGARPARFLIKDVSEEIFERFFEGDNPVVVYDYHEKTLEFFENGAWVTVSIDPNTVDIW